MSKPEVNNQIVLMRKDVVQAQVQIVKNLSRAVKKLRDKKGTDAQKAKNLRKADRIVAEILAVKKAKKDEIIHFALTNSSTLEEILQDLKSDPLKRIKARIANHKNFSKKIAEFKEKYPNYLKLIEPGRKKRAKLERKEKKEMKKLQKNEKSENADEKIKVVNDKEENDKPNESNNENLGSEKSSDSETESLANDFADSDEHVDDKNENLDIKVIKKECEEKIVKLTKKVKDKSVGNVGNEESKKLFSNEQKEVKLDDKSESVESKKSKKNKKTMDIPKAVSELATVKKFADILKEEEIDSQKNEEPKVDTKISSIDVEKEVDPFFVTENHSDFLSVAPRKRKIDVEGNMKMDFIQFNPDKAPPNKYFKNNDSKFDSKPNPKWNNQRNDRPRFDSNKSNYKERNGKERKENFNKFTYESKQRQPSRKERRAVENEDNKNLHPSWEAKKKQQDALKLGFQGKKIVFGDD